jgi:hypothetical protein
MIKRIFSYFHASYACLLRMKRGFFWTKRSANRCTNQGGIGATSELKNLSGRNLSIFSKTVGSGSRTTIDSDTYIPTKTTAAPRELLELSLIAHYDGLWIPEGRESPSEIECQRSFISVDLAGKPGKPRDAGRGLRHSLLRLCFLLRLEVRWNSDTT